MGTAAADPRPERSSRPAPSAGPESSAGPAPSPGPESSAGPEHSPGPDHAPRTPPHRLTARQRSRQIAEILVAHGLQSIASQFGLGEHVLDLVPMLRRAAGGSARHDRGAQAGGRPDRGAQVGARPDRDAQAGSRRDRDAQAGSHPDRGAQPSGPVRLRQALEELGPTFVKLGQMLATRNDLLPAAYITELDRLQDAVGPVPYEQIAEVIRAELGAPPEEAFASFETQPLATASIGQTHRATLHDGAEVVVKVQKPHVDEDVLADLDILRALAEVAARESALARDIDLVGLEIGFDRTMRQELDFRTEADNADRFAQNLGTRTVVRIPRVHHELTTARVLTEQVASGMRITDTAALDAAGLDRTELAAQATRAVIDMVLVDGFFHADPHPGNMFVRPDGKIWLIDFGMVGRLSEAVREDILRLLLTLSHGDREQTTAALLRLAPPSRRLDRRALTRDIGALIDRLRARPLAETPLSDIVEHLMGILRQHRLQLPPDVSALLRMLVLLESSAVILDPGFHVSAVLSEAMPIAIMQLMSPEGLARRSAATALQAARIGGEIPQRLERMLDEYDDHGIDVRLHAEDLDRLVDRLEGTSDRLIAGMTMSALLIGVSTTLASGTGRAGRARDPFMLAAGGLAGVLGAFLAAGAGPGRTIARALRRGISGR